MLKYKWTINFTKELKENDHFVVMFNNFLVKFMVKKLGATHIMTMFISKSVT